MPSYTGGQATFNVVPSFKGTQQRVTAGMKQLRADDLKIRVELDKKSLAAAEAEAKAASQRLANARNTERDATERVARAERNLTDARARGQHTAGGLAMMEQRLAREKQAAAAASNAAAKAHADETRAKSSVVSANDRLAASNNRLRRSQQGLSGAMNSFRSVGNSINAAKREINQADRVLTKASMSALKLGAYSTAAATALVGVGGATGPVLALGAALATAAGSAALIPAALAGAGASFAALKFGLGGVGDAFKASGAAAEASGAAGAKSAQEGIQRARQQRDAQQAVTDAIRNQIRTRADGARRVDDAVRRAAEAEEAYKDAVKEATTALRDLNAEVKSSSLSVEEAEIGLERAKERLRELKAQSDTNPLDLREAEVGVKRANLSLEEARTRYSDVSKEAAEANRVGVAGAKNVVDAQRGVQDANRAVADAQRDSAEANEDAARAVRDAVEGLRDSYQETGSAAQTAGDKAQEALAKLSPNARAFVQSVLGMRDAWDRMKNSVQDRLFAGFADEVKLLGGRYIPILRDRLGDIAGSFNTATLEMSQWLRSARGVSMVDNTLKNTSKTADQLARAAAPLTNVFFGFAEIGSAALTPLASKFADASERAVAFVNSAAGAEKIKGWIDNGVTALGQLWQLLKNVGGIIGTVWRTANEVGGSTLQLLVDLTGQADEWVKSVEGQEVLKELFTTIRDVVNELKPGVGAVLGAIKDAFITLAPSLPGLARAFSDIVIALSPMVGQIASGLKWLIDNALIPFANWARDNPEEFRRVAWEILGIVVAVKGLNIAKKVTDWCTGIASAFGLIRKDADKASTAVGKDANSGVRGNLGKLAKFAGLTIGITLLIAVLQELGAEGDRIQEPVKNIPQKDRTAGQEAQNVWGGELGKFNDNPLGAFSKNWGKDPFTWFFGRSPDEFADGIKNSLFSKLSEKFEGSVGAWLDEKVAIPTQTFFKELPGKITGFSDSMGQWAETNIRQPIITKTGEMGTNVQGTFTTMKIVVGGIASGLSTNVTGTFTTMKILVGDAVGGLSTNFTGTFTTMKVIVGGIVSGISTNITGTFTTMRVIVGNTISGLSTNFTGTFTTMKVIVGGIVSGISTNITGTFTTMRVIVGNTISGLSTNFTGTFTTMRIIVGGIVSGISTNITGTFTTMRIIVGDTIRNLSTNFTGTFTTMKVVIGGLVSGISTNVTGTFTTMRIVVGDTIDKLVDKVGRKWDELKGFFARPIKWVIDEVWNGTIARLWGKARGLIPALPEFQKLATGGPVRGPGGPTADRIPILASNGEHMLDAQDVKNLGGHGGVMALRNAAASGMLPRFAEGGPVSWDQLRDAVLRGVPGSRMSSGYRPGHAGEHGKGLAADFTGNMPAIQRWIVANFPASHEIIGPVTSLNRFNGRPHRYDAGTVAEHMDHVHWARKEHGKGLLSRIGDALSGAWDYVSTFFRDSMAGIFDGPANWIRGEVGKLFPGDSLAHRIPKDGTNQIIDGVRDFLFGKADEQDALAGGDMIADGGPTTGDMLGNARVIGNVARALGFGRNGVVVALATALQESGLRNINYGDRDSVGLFQQRPSMGWGSVAQIMNPSYSASKFFNALRGVRGWERLPVTVAAQRVQRSAFPDAYAKWVGKANQLASQVGFSDGGSIPGRPGRDDKLALVQGGERVLTPNQNAWLESALRAASTASAVSQMQRGHGMGSLVGAVPGGGSRGPLIGEFHAHETVDTDAAVSRIAFLSGGV